MRNMTRFLLAAAAAFAVGAAPATAAVHYKRFHSPSGKIRCYLVQFGPNDLECTAPYLPDVGEFDPYYGLKKRGKAVHAERSDYPGYDTEDQELQYGETWKRRGITCKIRESGLRCRNKSRHGFFISMDDQHRF